MVLRHRKSVSRHPIKISSRSLWMRVCYLSNIKWCNMLSNRNQVHHQCQIDIIGVLFERLLFITKYFPGLTSPGGSHGYINDAYEMNDVMSRHHGNIQRTLVAGSSLPVNSLAQLQSQMIPSAEVLQRTQTNISPAGPAQFTDTNTYQVIKWSPHQMDIWCRLTDIDGKEL